MNIKTNINNLKNYKIYLKVESAVNEYLQNKGYLKVDLPVLSPALIPESYLEIFETEFNYFNKKEKLYLTPSPELFLKRLLAYGLGNCYYLGKAFRNSEPNSSWHLPEFTMLEFYKTNVNYLKFADEILALLQWIAKKINNSHILNYQGKNISFKKWEKMTVSQAFVRYAKINEKILFDDIMLGQKAKDKGYDTKGFSYEEIFSQIFTQEIEPKLGKNGFPTLIYDYPKKLASLSKLNQNGITAQRCEFYIDGLEVGGFCSELNDYKEQLKRFKHEIKRRKQAKLINHTVDREFIDALKYGLIDCTGAGIGFERLVMIFANVTSIEELKLITIK